MYSFQLFLILCASCVLCRGDSLLTACRYDDMACLSKTTEQFLESTCKGIPSIDVRPIDPLVIPSLDHLVDENSGLTMHFKNLSVYGLKNQRFYNFKMDRIQKLVTLQTKMELSVDGDVKIAVSKSGKSFSGTYSAKGSALATAKYNYSFINDDAGVQHYEVGPETISCQALGDPEITINVELAEMLANDPEIKEGRQRTSDADKSALKQKTFCKIIEVAYVTVIHNIRASARVLPKTAFLLEDE